MERRDALKYTALFMGISLSGSTVATLLNGCAVDDSPSWIPGFLTADEAAFLDELSETMLPRTSTPGAGDALVTRFIDTVRPLRFSEEDNMEFKKNLGVFIARTNESLGKNFSKATAQEKHEWLAAIDKQAYEMMKQENSQNRPFYISLKEQILAGYFSSEVVAKQYFEFDPVPGKYIACMPYEDVGKAWAL